MQAILWCPLVYLFLRGVAKLKGLQDEAFLHSNVHVEELDILMVGVSLVFHTINPNLLSFETTIKNAMND